VNICAITCSQTVCNCGRAGERLHTPSPDSGPLQTLLCHVDSSRES